MEIIREAATHVRPGEAVLVIGHGGWIELTVAAAVGRIPIEGYGPSLRNLEGVRLSFDEGKFEVDHVWRRAADHEGGNS